MCKALSSAIRSDQQTYTKHLLQLQASHLSCLKILLQEILHFGHKNHVGQLEQLQFRSLDQTDRNSSLMLFRLWSGQITSRMKTLITSTVKRSRRRLSLWFESPWKRTALWEFFWANFQPWSNTSKEKTTNNKEWSTNSDYKWATLSTLNRNYEAGYPRSLAFSAAQKLGRARCTSKVQRKMKQSLFTSRR